MAARASTSPALVITLSHKRASASVRVAAPTAYRWGVSRGVTPAARLDAETPPGVPAERGFLLRQRRPAERRFLCDNNPDSLAKLRPSLITALTERRSSCARALICAASAGYTQD